MRNLGVKTFPEIVLQSIFRFAVKAWERGYLSHHVRADRSVLWWATVLQWPASQRYREGWAKSRQGAFAHHEDLFVAVWGETWRCVVCKPTRPSERRDLECKFVQFSVERFNLKYTGDYSTRCPRQLRDDQEPKCVEVMSRAFQLPPTQTFDEQWGDSMAAVQIEFVLDCQSLVMVLTAQGVLEDSEEHASARLSDALQQIFSRTLDGSIIPRAGYLEMFRWVPRDLNRAADWMANWALFNKQDRMEGDVEQIRRAVASSRPLGIQIFTDGGFDPHAGTGATGVVLCIWTQIDILWERRCALKAARYFAQARSAFHMEAEAPIQAMQITMSIF